jgi:hypothetical protein
MIKRLAAMPQKLFLLLQLIVMGAGLALFYYNWPGGGVGGDLTFGGGVLIFVGLVLQVAPLWIGGRVGMARRARRRW